MLAHVTTGTVLGVEPSPVRVEVGLAPGLPAFTVVGLAQHAVREGRERVASALRSSGFALPSRRITVSLAPGHRVKTGTGFDLPIAVALLAAAGELRPEAVAGVGLVGELGLDGGLRPVPGVLPIAACLAERGLAHTLVTPEGNAAEASLVADLRVLGASSLEQVVAHLRGHARLRPSRVDADEILRASARDGLDLADVRGQESAKRALEIAAAGSHALLLVGPPGSGKTMLALRLPGLLPAMSLAEALECTRVHSAAGLLEPGRALLARRPFRAPHHSVSEAGLIGGGNPLRPGEISLAHHGVLFLDELPEFRRGALEALRQPLEDGAVQVTRIHGTARLPARFLLAAAMNPCPCGHLGDGTDRCVCDPSAVSRYRGRVSGPLLDRIDLQVPVPPVPAGDLERAARAAVSSGEVRARVEGARAAQRERFGERGGVHANGHMGPGDVRRWCVLDARARALLSAAVERLGLSARGYHRVLRVARTIADLDGSSPVTGTHVAEALQFRRPPPGTEGGSSERPAA